MYDFYAWPLNCTCVTFYITFQNKIYMYLYNYMSDIYMYDLYLTFSDFIVHVHVLVCDLSLDFSNNM